MNCECKPRLTVEFDKQRAANALMCYSCKHGKWFPLPRNLWVLFSGEGFRWLKKWLRKGPVRCGLSGQAVRLTISTGSCPKKYHVDRSHKVKWLGVNWYGVPSFKRAAFMLVNFRWPKVPLCGCVVTFKDAWDEIKLNMVG